MEGSLKPLWNLFSAIVLQLGYSRISKLTEISYENYHHQW